MGLKGWWVGNTDLGGVLIRAATANRARFLGAASMGVDYVDVRAVRVPALDGTVPEGEVDWDEGRRLGAVRVCSHCGGEAAVTRRRWRCPECGGGEA